MDEEALQAVCKELTEQAGRMWEVQRMHEEEIRLRNAQWIGALKDGREWRERAERAEQEVQRLRERVRELEEYKYQNEQVIKAAAEIVPYPEWFCSRCGKNIDPRDVTYQETHEGCGGQCL